MDISNHEWIKMEHLKKKPDDFPASHVTLKVLFKGCIFLRGGEVIQVIFF